MVRRLRRGERRGLLFANGGHCTHNHSLVLSSLPPEPSPFPQDYDAQAEADALRGAVPRVAEAYVGPVLLETFAVTYAATGQVERGVAISRNPAGERVVARVDGRDAAAVAFLTDGRREPVGAPGTVTRGVDALYWRPAAG
jgi:acetyl-CoA C-acetyltransferase